MLYFTGQGQQAYWNLGIRILKVTDAGQYRCKVTGTDQFVTHTLKILGNCVVFIFPYETVSCLSHGVLSPLYTNGFILLV